MDTETVRAGDRQSKEPYHLCVLIHGLWGNPKHLDYVAGALRERYKNENLHILLPKRNSGNFTYDGIELGGERVTHEIEYAREALEKEGKDVVKLSVVGYSLGGLVARYAIGLLLSKGWFETIQAVNFTTFATPYLGVRTPRVGVLNKLFNVIGARSLSTSGRQLFMIDSFRETGRPLLSVLADENSIFMQGLTQFNRRSLYANIVNDRTAVYYTTGVSRIDPSTDMNVVKVNYLEGYEDVIVDPSNPVSPVNPKPPSGLSGRIWSGGYNVFATVPKIALVTVLVPVGLTLFLINSGVQTVRSGRRIQLHEQGKAGIVINNYRIPLMVEGVQHAVEEALEDLEHGSRQDYLPNGPRESAATRSRSPNEHSEDAPLDGSSSQTSHGKDSPSVVVSQLDTSSSTPSLEDPPKFPTLALTADQFAIIESLDALGFNKYPVHIHKSGHSHAAIIVRKPWKSFQEGKVVIRHWLDREFDI